LEKTKGNKGKSLRENVATNHINKEYGGMDRVTKGMSRVEEEN